ncbi:hypothetical protein [Occultella aeris]|uniref:hypothetical protein n=1 Tax=Occultella aeris TaxID=2761496 RepID=UPI0012EA3A06|nr:hypothetical protein [Occultella aeris]
MLSKLGERLQAVSRSRLSRFGRGVLNRLGCAHLGQSPRSSAAAHRALARLDISPAGAETIRGLNRPPPVSRLLAER